MKSSGYMQGPVREEHRGWRNQGEEPEWLDGAHKHMSRCPYPCTSHVELGTGSWWGLILELITMEVPAFWGLRVPCRVGRGQWPYPFELSWECSSQEPYVPQVSKWSFWLDRRCYYDCKCYSSFHGTWLSGQQGPQCRRLSPWCHESMEVM